MKLYNVNKLEKKMYVQIIVSLYGCNIALTSREDSYYPESLLQTEWQYCQAYEK